MRGQLRMTVTAMSPDLAFILTLALRMAITAAFVVSASVITERYCVVYQTIKNGPKVSVTMHRV